MCGLGSPIQVNFDLDASLAVLELERAEQELRQQGGDGEEDAGSPADAFEASTRDDGELLVGGPKPALATVEKRLAAPNLFRERRYAGSSAAHTGVNEDGGFGETPPEREGEGLVEGRTRDKVHQKQRDNRRRAEKNRKRAAAAQEDRPRLKTAAWNKFSAALDRAARDISGDPSLADSCVINHPSILQTNAPLSMDNLNAASSAYVGKNIEVTEVDRRSIAVSDLAELEIKVITWDGR